MVLSWGQISKVGGVALPILKEVLGVGGNVQGALVEEDSLRQDVGSGCACQHTFANLEEAEGLIGMLAPVQVAVQAACLYLELLVVHAVSRTAGGGRQATSPLANGLEAVAGAPLQALRVERAWVVPLSEHVCMPPRHELPPKLPRLPEASQVPRGRPHRRKVCRALSCSTGSDGARSHAQRLVA